MHKAVLEKETHAKWEPYSCVSSPTEFELALDFFFLHVVFKPSHQLHLQLYGGLLGRALLFPLCSVRSKLRFPYHSL